MLSSDELAVKLTLESPRLLEDKHPKEREVPKYPQAPFSYQPVLDIISEEVYATMLIFSSGSSGVLLGLNLNISRIFLDT